MAFEEMIVKRFTLCACALAGVAMAFGTGLAQTSQGPGPRSATPTEIKPGTKVSPLPGSTDSGSGSSVKTEGMAPSPSGATPETGSKVEPLPPPDSSTAGSGTSTTPVPPPSAPSTPSGTVKQ